jgi:Immunity protein 52
MEQFVQRFGWNRKAPADRHVGVLPDRTMSREGRSRLGFHINLNSSGRSTKPETVCLSMRGGTPGTVLSGVTSIEFPEVGAPEFQHFDFVKRLMQATVECWRPEQAYVTSIEFHEAQQVKTAYANAIGWMNYFANAGVREAAPPDVECESFGPGGVLLTLQRDPPSPDDAQGVARAKRIREALLPGRWFDYEVTRATSVFAPSAT